MMTELDQLLKRITQRVNINLRERRFDVGPYVHGLIPTPEQMAGYHGFYGLTPHHDFDYRFTHSSLAGSYFLGRCRISDAVLYKSDIRGDELKHRGELFWFRGNAISVDNDESIHIDNSVLIKTLVHSHSYDPESLERFAITNTVSAHYANIHGAPIDGCFLCPFSTLDRTTANDCIIGTYAYIRTAEIDHLDIAPGTVWIREPDRYNFLYRYPREQLQRYIHLNPGGRPLGIFMHFVDDRKEAFQNLFNRVSIAPSVPIPDTASLDRFAVIKPRTHIGENVLVAQRAYLQNAWLGTGSNAQENSYIINSRLEGYNVASHGAKIIETDLGANAYVGFNSFLRGRPGGRLTVDSENIILPHTIIDVGAPLTIPPGHLVWGLITSERDLETQALPLDTLAGIRGDHALGRTAFEGDGSAFVGDLRNRILHVLADNGAFYNGRNAPGHAQKNQHISFNTIQPYPDGPSKGLYPTIIIREEK